MALFYPDTDAFRHLGTAFRDRDMPADLRKHVVVSPITALEVMSQLVTADRATILAQIQAMNNWLPEHPRLLPMTTYAIAQVAFGKSIPDEVHEPITYSLNVCRQTRDVDQLVEQAGKLRDFLDGWKAEEAAKLKQFQQMALADIRAGFSPPDRVGFIRAIREGLAMRAGVSPRATQVLGLRRIFNAFFEYEEERNLILSSNRHYNPASSRNINDGLDSEQLIYLCDPDLSFVTCDRKYARRVTKSKQARQIVTLDSAELRDPMLATSALRRVAGL